MKSKIFLLSILFFLFAFNGFGATLSGFVRDADNLEGLYGANAFLANTRFGAITNVEGYYTITSIPPGEYEVYYSYMGYETIKKPITIKKATEDILIDVEMQTKAIEMDAVEVTGDKLEKEIRPSLIQMKSPALKKVPQVAEADLFRAVQALPGVSTLSDFSSGLYVRGGSPDQNLILLDDIDVYNPTHMFGFFSTFNVDAVKSVELQKGGYPARYGGRLSSVLDVHNRDGNRKEFQGTTRLSFLSASATLEGPWQKGSWMLSGRRSYIEQAGKALLDEKIPYYFYDFHGKINYDVSQSDLTSASFYSGKDNLDWDQERIKMYVNWGNDTFSSQWTHLFSSRLYSRFIFAGSQYKSEAKITFLGDFSFKMLNEVRDMALKGILSYNAGANHNIDFGFENKFLNFSLERTMGDSEFKLDYDGIYSALYAQSHYELNPVWEMQTGIRASYYSEGDHINFTPRLSIRHYLNENFTVHGTYGKYYQYLNMILEEGFSAGDMWFPVDETINPGRAHHYIFGFQYDPQTIFSIEAEAYYKDYDNLVELDDEYVNSGEISDENKNLDLYVNTGVGRAYGFDVYLKNNFAGLEGWVGYSFCDTKKQIEDYNFGKEYYPQYDRRHQIVLMEDMNLGKGFKLNFAFKYGSGQPFTRATARYSTVDVGGKEYDNVLEGEKNKYRLPDYHRLDIGLYYRKKFKNWAIEPYFQVINVYNRENVFVRSYDTDKNPAEYEDVTMLPLFPSLGLNVEF